MYHTAERLTQPLNIRYDEVYKGAAMKRFDVGSRVVEPTYGLGSVVAVEDNYTRVQFDEHGIKKFLTAMSRLEPSSEPLPPGMKGKVRKKRVPKKAAAVAEPADD
jgi:hypothetical protein